VSIALSFASPGWLALLALLPLAGLLYQAGEQRRTRARAAFATPKTMPSVERARPRWRRHVAPALYALALAGLVLALAKPERTVAVPREQASVILTTDVSSSMRATDVKPSRLAAARGAAQRFVDRAPKRIRIGAVLFSGRIERIEAPSADRAGVREVLRTAKSRGRTATGDGLAASLRLVDGRTGRRPPAAIVLLSDGASTRGRDPLEVAEEAADLRIPIHTVALGTDNGTITSASGQVRPVPPDRQSLAAIAERTGGQALRADDADQLDAVYDKLRSQVATKHERREVTAAFGGIAGLLLLGGALLSVRWFGRIP
jgi:Ca-activated chloride channel family protein